MIFPELVFRLPEWIDEYFKKNGFSAYSSLEEKMRFVVKFAELNIDNGTGGPFAAAVFEVETGHLIAPGVNIVMPSNCSSAHAEILALSLAQKMIGSFSLSPGENSYELVTSTEPCAMCMGAVHWSGISSLVCGARDEDARKYGFDEGPKVPDWVRRFEKAGIKVNRDILRSEAAAVIENYATSGGIIYKNSNRR